MNYDRSIITRSTSKGPAGPRCGLGEHLGYYRILHLDTKGVRGPGVQIIRTS